MLDPDRHPHHVRPGARGDQFLAGQLAVGGRGGVDDQRSRVTDIGEMAEQLDVADELDAGVIATLDTKGQ